MDALPVHTLRSGADGSPLCVLAAASHDGGTWTKPERCVVVFFFRVLFWSFRLFVFSSFRRLRAGEQEGGCVRARESSIYSIYYILFYMPFTRAYTESADPHARYVAQVVMM